MWQDLLSAGALLLVLEGIRPFDAPGAWGRAIAQLNALNDSQLRIGGAISMSLGLAALYAVRHWL